MSDKKYLPILQKILSVFAVSAVSIVVVALAVSFYGVRSVQSYDPFINLLLDPNSWSRSDASTLQLKSFGFLSPTPDIRPEGAGLVECGPSGNSIGAYNVPGDENKVLAAYSPAPPAIAGAADKLILWYRDEHAMALGVSSVETSDPANPSQSFPIEVYPGGLSSQVETTTGAVRIGAPYQYADGIGQRDARFDGVDTSGRPIPPSIFLTDITTDPNSTVGDWENGGVPIYPHFIYGQWKVLIKQISSSGKISYSQDVLASGANNDPPGNYNDKTNSADLGPFGDTIPEGVVVQNHGEHVGEAAWSIQRLIDEGHMQVSRTYRVQFMAHDGDQSSRGGDVGEACGTVRL